MNAYEVVTERIIAQLDKGIIPWKRGFNIVGPSTPTNYLTKKAYRGVNVLMLFCSGYPTSEWLTYKQAQDIGGQVRKGEKSSPVVFWKIGKKDPASDGGEVIAGENGKPETYAFCRTYNVFNISQIDGITRPLPFEPSKPFDVIAEAQAIADGYLNKAGAPTLFHGGNQPYYSPASDYVQMPEHGKWTASERYYKTLFHELAHSTGHSSRLDRKFGAKFGSDPYAKEELVAEFTAAFLAAQCGINSEDVELNSVAYIQNWIAQFKNDSKLAMQAAQKAQRAADLIAGTSYAAESIETLAA